MARTTNHPTMHQSRYSYLRAKYFPFFWFLGAADEDILRRCSITEQDKQAGFGAAILLTALAAVLSGFFAFQLIFYNWMIALPVALFWGMIIFNLDRFMVGTLKKDPNSNRLNEMLVASPRIVLAFLIAILISKPIEVKIMENQIDAKSAFLVEKGRDSIASSRVQELNSEMSLRENLAKQKSELEQKQNECSTAPGWSSLNTEYNNCMANYNQLARQRDEKRGKRIALSKDQRFIVYVRKDINNDGVIGDDEFAPQLSDEGVDERNRLNAEINDLDRRMDQLGCTDKRNQRDKVCADYQKHLGEQIKENSTRIGQLDTSTQQRSADIKVLKANTEAQLRIASQDIFGKLSTLEALKEDDRAIQWASWLITLLFFILETAPLFVKILANRGEYDSRLMVAEQLVFDDERAVLSESATETEARIQSGQRNGAQLTEAEQAMNRATMEKVMRAQAQLTEQIVDAWVSSETEKLTDNREEYLRERVTLVE